MSKGTRFRLGSLGVLWVTVWLLPACQPSDLLLSGSVLTEDGGLSVEQAAAVVGEATDDFIAGSGQAAAEALRDSMATLFDVSDGLEAGLDAADSSIAARVNTAEDLQALQDQSLALSGDYVEGQAGGAAAGKAATRQQSACDADSETVVIFINGINNTYPEFLESWAALAKLLRDGPGTVSPKVDGYYNLSAVDAERSIFGGKICYLYGASSWMPTDDAIRITEWCRILGGVIIDLAECGAQTANIQKWINSMPPVPEAERFSTFIRNHIDEGRKVVIVAHSQGNLMTSQALEFLTTPDGNLVPNDHVVLPVDSVGVVSVGSPTNSFSARLDRLYPVMIRGEVMNTSLPLTDLPSFSTWGANAEPPSEDMNFVARHNFNDSYLRSEGARQLIRQAVTELDCNLSNPRAKFRISGVVTDAETGAAIQGALVNMIPAGAGSSQATFTTGADGAFGTFTYRHKNASFPQVEITVHKAGYVDASVTQSYDRTKYGSDYVPIALEPEEADGGTDDTGDGAEVCATSVEVSIMNFYGDERLMVGHGKTYSAVAWGTVPGQVQFTWDLLGEGASLSASGAAATVTGTAPGLVTLIAEARDAQYGCPLGSKSITISIERVPTYRVYVVQQICRDGQLEVFSESAAEAGIAMCNVGGGGLDCSITAIVTPLTDAYPTPEEAVLALCPRITSYLHGYWSDYVGVDGVEYCFGSLAAYDEFWECAPD